MQLSQFNSWLLPKTSVQHPPSTLLSTCLQLQSQVLLPCTALKPKQPFSNPAQLIKPPDNCCCVLTAWELERLSKGSEEQQSQGKSSTRSAQPAAGRQVGREDRTIPFQQQRPVSLAQLDLLTSPLSCLGQWCWLMSAKSVVKQLPVSHFSHVGKQDFNEQFTYLQLRIC